VERPDRPLVPLKAGHPRTPMPPSQAVFGMPMRSPDVVLVHMKPTLGPARPQLYPGWPLSEPHRRPCGRFPKTTPEPTSGVGYPPWATFLICTCAISTPADHVNASRFRPAHVCVVNRPAAPRRDDPSRVRCLYYPSRRSTMFPGTYA
jgi:hypothetical protein